MAILDSRKITSATLIEVVVSLVIIMIVFGIAMTIYINVLGSSSSERVLDINLLLKELNDETITANRLFDEQIERGGFRVIKSVEEYNGIKGLVHLHFEVVDGGKVITRDQLLIVESNEEN